VTEEVLSGGVANAGEVVRSGLHVLRPASAHTEAIHELLRYVRAAGFDGAPHPVRVEPDGRERLVFIEGDVPCPPFPAWSQTDEALASTAALLARFHEAVAGFVWPPGTSWNDELADPEGGSIMCHTDVCPENVVYRGGVAVALLDFDFVAPGRPTYDLAQLAKMCVPIDTPEDAAVLGRGQLDPFRRLRVVADAYGLPPDRTPFLDVLEEAIETGGQFVRRRVERGDEAFIVMWNQMGGQARYDRRNAWFERHRQHFLDVLD
jgi:Phosphotransferase enzyme family